MTEYKKVMVFSRELSSDQYFRSSLQSHGIGIADGLDNRGLVRPTNHTDPKNQVPTNTQALKIYSAWAVSEEFSRIVELISFELSREPGYDFDRSIERSAAARSLVFTWIKTFLDELPDLCLFPEAPHNAWNLSAMLVGEKLKIKHIWFQAAEPLAPVVFPRNRQGFYTDLRPLRAHEFGEVSSMCIEILENSFDQITRGNRPANAVELESQLKRTLHKVRKYVRILRSRPRRVLDPMPRLGLGRNVYEKVLFSLANRVIRRRFLEGQPNKPINKKELGFVFFPLHYQPEKSSIPEGPLIPFQADLVALVRSRVSSDYEIVVKEHPHQVIRQDGHFGRSPSVYPFLRSMPGVLLAPTRQDSRELIRSSKIVVTITGSVGLEAAAEGKPVIHLGEPWWKGLPGTIAMEDLKDTFDHRGLALHGPNELCRWLSDRATQAGFPGFATNSRKIFWSQRLGEQNTASIIRAEKEGIIESVKQILSR